MTAHTDADVLAAFRDGALAPDAAAAVQAHLSACAECRTRFEEIPASSPPPPPELLQSLRDRMRQYEADWGRPERRETTRRQVALELEPFIGDGAAAALLERVADDGHNLLSTLEPVLGLFLGRSAASVLVSHIVDTAI